MPFSLKNSIKNFLFQDLLYMSLKASARQKKYLGLIRKLVKSVPDITDQYTTTQLSITDRYLQTKVRNLHAFQVSLLLRAIHLQNKEKLCVVDIGDSSGAHMLYIKDLVKDLNLEIDALSVNLDPVAISKIKDKGLTGVLCRAEDLHKATNFQADIFTAFEVIEHFFDPITFLRKMSSEAVCNNFVITVPFLIQSRVGLQFIRHNFPGKRLAENTHIFELNSEDWDLIFKFSGWKVKYRETYFQYPKYHPLSFTKYLWRRFDFEGFYGVILEKDETYSSKYQDWQ